MTMDLSKLKIDLYEREKSLRDKKDKKTAEAVMKIMQRFPSNLFNQIEDNKKEFLGRIASLPDEVLQLVLADFMKEHKHEGLFDFIFWVSIPTIFIKIKSSDTNTLEYYYYPIWNLYLPNYMISSEGELGAIRWGSIPIDEQFDIYYVFNSLCKTISDKGLIMHFDDKNYKAIFTHTTKIFEDALENRLTEFGLKVISSKSYNDDVNNEESYKFHFTVKNPLIDN